MFSKLVIVATGIVACAGLINGSGVRGRRGHTDCEYATTQSCCGNPSCNTEGGSCSAGPNSPLCTTDGSVMPCTCRLLQGPTYVTVSGRVGCEASGHYNIVHEDVEAAGEECEMAITMLFGNQERATKFNGHRSANKRPAYCYYDHARGKIQYNMYSVFEDAALAADNDMRENICIEGPGVPTTSLTPTTSSPTPMPSPSPTPMPTPTPTTMPTPSPTTPIIFQQSTSGCEEGQDVETVEECEDAAESLGFLDTTAKVNGGRKKKDRPFGCYYDARRESLQFNPAGVKQIDATRPSLCKE